MFFENPTSQTVIIVFLYLSKIVTPLSDLMQRPTVVKSYTRQSDDLTAKCTRPAKVSWPYNLCTYFVLKVFKILYFFSNFYEM